MLDSLTQAVPMQNVGDQVESALDYPVEFRNAGMEGTVTADVRFSADGTLEKPVARSRSNYLRVHVLRVLRRTLASGLPLTYTRGRPVGLRFRFDFILSDADQLIRPEVREVNGNFHFQRVGRGFGEWKLGPLRGVWFVPAVALDPEWIVDAAKKTFSRKAEIDPLETYRRDPDW